MFWVFFGGVLRIHGYAPETVVWHFLYVTVQVAPMCQFGSLAGAVIVH